DARRWRGHRDVRRLHACRRRRHGGRDRRAEAREPLLARLDGRRRDARVPGRQGAPRHRDLERGLMGAVRPPGMPLVAANWKMNPTNIDDALDLVRGVMAVARGQADKVEVAIFPPFPWLMGVSDLLVDSGVKLGAQDTFWEMSGAFTGEVSPAMLKTLCQWVIVGHSERRLYVGET